MKIQPIAKVYCPICVNAPAGEILAKYEVMATTDRKTKVGGLRVFMCSSVGHVFFVRRADTDLAEIASLRSLPAKPARGNRQRTSQRDSISQQNAQQRKFIDLLGTQTAIQRRDSTTLRKIAQKIRNEEHRRVLFFLAELIKRHQEIKKTAA